MYRPETLLGTEGKTDVLPRTSAVAKDLAAIVTLHLVAILGIQKGVDSYFEAPAQVSTSDAVREPEYYAWDFDALSDGTVLLDTTDPAFKPYNLRLSPPEGDKRESIVIRYSVHPEKGPLVEVGGKKFWIANRLPGGRLFGKTGQASRHVWKKTKTDAKTIELVSATKAFSGGSARVSVADEFDAAHALKASKGNCMVDVHVQLILPNGTMEYIEHLEFILLTE